MTLPPARSEVTARPAGTPAAIRAVLAANADSDVLRRYDDELVREEADIQAGVWAGITHGSI